MSIIHFIYFLFFIIFIGNISYLIAQYFWYLLVLKYINRTDKNCTDWLIFCAAFGTLLYYSTPYIYSSDGCIIVGCYYCYHLLLFLVWSFILMSANYLLTLNHVWNYIVRIRMSMILLYHYCYLSPILYVLLLLDCINWISNIGLIISFNILN